MQTILLQEYYCKNKKKLRNKNVTNLIVGYLNVFQNIRINQTLKLKYRD